MPDEVKQSTSRNLDNDYNDRFQTRLACSESIESDVKFNKNLISHIQQACVEISETSSCELEDNNSNSLFSPCHHHLKYSNVGSRDLMHQSPMRPLTELMRNRYADLEPLFTSKTKLESSCSDDFLQIPTFRIKRETGGRRQKAKQRSQSDPVDCLALN